MTLIPSEAKLVASLPTAAAILKKELESGATEATNIATLVDSHIATLDWPGASLAKSETESYRARRAAFIQARIRRMIDPILLGFARRQNSQATSVAGAWNDVIRYWVDNTITVKERAFTRATALTTGGGGTYGNPTLHRCLKDRNGLVVESSFQENTTVKAETTQPNTAVGEEVLRLSLPRGLDLFSLDIAGEPDAGPVSDLLYTMTNRDGLVRDFSFERPGAAVSIGAMTAGQLGAWTVDSGLSALGIQADGYRESARERSLGSKYSLIANGDFTISQPLRTVSYGVPYALGFRMQRNANVTGGTLAMKVGNVTVATVTLTSKSAGSWHGITPSNDILRWAKPLIAAASTGFLGTQDPPKIEIVLSGLTGTSPQVDVDTVLFYPMTPWNGSWLYFEPGSTAITGLYEESFDDTIASDSVIQKIMFLGYGPGYHLPHSGTPSISDP